MDGRYWGMIIRILLRLLNSLDFHIGIFLLIELVLLLVKLLIAGFINVWFSTLGIIVNTDLVVQLIIVDIKYLKLIYRTLSKSLANIKFRIFLHVHVHLCGVVLTKVSISNLIHWFVGLFLTNPINQSKSQHQWKHNHGSNLNSIEWQLYIWRD